MGKSLIKACTKLSLFLLKETVNWLPCLEAHILSVSVKQSVESQGCLICPFIMSRCWMARKKTLLHSKFTRQDHYNHNKNMTKTCILPSCAANIYSTRFHWNEKPSCMHLLSRSEECYIPFSWQVNSSSLCLWEGKKSLSELCQLSCNTLFPSSISTISGNFRWEVK